MSAPLVGGSCSCLTLWMHACCTRTQVSMRTLLWRKHPSLPGVYHRASHATACAACRRPQSAVIEEVETTDVSSDGSVDAILECSIYSNAEDRHVVDCPLTVQELMTVASRMVSCTTAAAGPIAGVLHSCSSTYCTGTVRQQTLVLQRYSPFLLETRCSHLTQ